ncbi:hypothetical protein GJV06_12935 [Enterobacteriaceae bacterium RIT691]|nr:hypothetical protein [Enterobacteriaceae bacterium RIT691]
MWSFIIMKNNSHRLWIIASAFTLSACSISPSVPILGAAFPDWLFCLIGGISLTWLLHGLSSQDWRARMLPHAVCYPLISATLSMLLWLFIFS